MMWDGSSGSWRDDRPWDEYEWEAFLREQDLLTDRYMELETKYRDEPDADERIAREMGWTLPWTSGPHDGWAAGDGDDETVEELLEPAAPSYEDDPLWQRAHEVAVSLHGLADNRADGAAHTAVPELLTHAAMIAAKIAGGRSMGFSRDALGGNIANHKRAMCHTLESLAALDKAERASAIASRDATHVRARLLSVRERLMDRIVELRRMFSSDQFVDD